MKEMDCQNIKLTKFRPKMTRLKRPMITLNKLGFRFNKACENHMNRHYKYCELYFDKNEMVVAIKPTMEMSENALWIIRAKTGNPFVSAREFLNKTGIKEKIKFPSGYGSMRILPVWNEKARMFFLDLKPLIK